MGMSERVVEANKAPLVERKQRAARNRIIEAAEALFAERGFDAVSVTDIAERAEVGRTTFFRLFGDKAEVVFAKEHAMFEAIADATTAETTHTHRLDSLASALSFLEPLVLQLCRQATADAAAYRRHVLLLDAHEELRARDALKNQHIANELVRLLREHNAPADIATIAAQLALACHASGRILATSPGGLVDKTRAAFRSVLAMNAVAAKT
jgi:AcrR family transcriptional regulator